MARWLKFCALLLTGVLVCGCAGRSSLVKSHGRAGPLRIASIDAAAPATASRQVERQAITLPTGSVLEMPDRTGTIARAVLSAPAELVRELTRDELVTATAPAPPSPLEIARGWGLKVWTAAGVTLAILGIVLGARGHGKACGAALLGALLVPLIGHWVNSTAGVIIGAILAAVALTFFAAWHILRRRGLLTSSV